MVQNQSKNWMELAEIDRVLRDIYGIPISQKKDGKVCHYGGI